MESEGVKLFHHFSHRHPLTLGNRNCDDEINCSICHRRCSGQTYVCRGSGCKSFSLHQSCFDLPEVIRHQIHGRHPLVLDTFKESQECVVCSVRCVGFFYHCCYCQIYLDVICLTKITSMIKCQGHEHNLFFSPNWNSWRPNSCCHACGTEPQMSSPIHSPLFRCFDCDFFLHLKCGPLPCTIEHENHRNDHPLILTDSPVVIDHEDKDGTDEFVCDVCEKLDRDPRLPVYYCLERCAYLAELECVISEVTRSLMGEHGEVELKTPIRHVPGKVIKIGMEVTELQEAGEDSETDDTKELEGYRELETIITDAEDVCYRGGSELYPFLPNENHVIRCMQAIYFEHIAIVLYKIFGYDWHERFVSRVEYANERVRHRLVHDWNRVNELRVKITDRTVRPRLVPWNLDRTLEDMSAKHGDISAESTLQSSKAKSYLMSMLCATINNMYATRVVDISKDRLANWWVTLKILQVAGFKVQFAFSHLKEVMDAYEGLQIEEAVREKRKKLRDEITQTSQTIEHLKAELAKQTAKLEELKKRSDDIVGELEFSSSESERVKKASERRWKVAGEGIL